MNWFFKIVVLSLITVFGINTAWTEAHICQCANISYYLEWQQRIPTFGVEKTDKGDCFISGNIDYGGEKRALVVYGWIHGELDPQIWSKTYGKRITLDEINANITNPGNLIEELIEMAAVSPNGQLLAVYVKDDKGLFQVAIINWKTLKGELIPLPQEVTSGLHEYDIDIGKVFLRDNGDMAFNVQGLACFYGAKDKKSTWLFKDDKPGKKGKYSRSSDGRLWAMSCFSAMSLNGEKFTSFNKHFVEVEGGFLTTGQIRVWEKNWLNKIKACKKQIFPRRITMRNLVLPVSVSMSSNGNKMFATYYNNIKANPLTDLKAKICTSGKCSAFKPIKGEVINQTSFISNAGIAVLETMSERDLKSPFKEEEDIWRQIVIDTETHNWKPLDELLYSLPAVFDTYYLMYPQHNGEYYLDENGEKIPNFKEARVESGFETNGKLYWSITVKVLIHYPYDAERHCLFFSIDTKELKKILNS